MNFDRQRPTPARLSAEATVAVPRVALLALLAAFALPGVFGRDLWPEDAGAFGHMWTMAHGTAADWLLPNVGKLATPQDGPFPFWLGAVAIRALGPWLGDVAASRVSALAWFALATLALWAATRRLAAGEAAQPITPAFGREPETSDYARLLADIAALLFAGTLGILVTLHVTSGDTVSMAIVATALYALSIAPPRRIAAAALAGACAGALALSRGPVLAIGLLAGCDAGLWLCAADRRGLRLAPVVVCTGCALAVAAAWPLAAWWVAPGSADQFASAWLETFVSAHGLLTRGDGIWLLRNASWYVWPLWPLAAWALYAWRHRLRAPHIALAVAVLAGLLLALAWSSPLDESKFVPTIPPLVVLAAFAFPTLRRPLAQWFEWFAMAVCTLFLAFVWAYFLAWISGTPHAMAASVLRLVVGFKPPGSTLPLVLGLLITGLWVGLIVWRVRRHPPMLWQGALLWTAGIVSLWLTTVALFLPATDYNRSYRHLAAQIGRRVPAGECVIASGVSPSLRAVLAFYGNVHFAADAEGACSMALQPQFRRTEAAPLPPEADDSWELVWEGHRRVRPDETWRLWRRRA